MDISISYRGGLNSKLDDELDKIVGVQAHSSGCCMFGDFERDRQYTLPEGKTFEQVEKEIEKHIKVEKM